jgi:hypothetical protein
MISIGLYNSKWAVNISSSLCVTTVFMNALNGKGPHYPLRAGSRSAHRQIAIIDVTNRLNYCIIFTVHAKFLNVAMGCRIQAGLPLVGDPFCTGIFCHGYSSSYMCFVIYQYAILWSLRKRGKEFTVVTLSRCSVLARGCRSGTTSTPCQANSVL